MTRRTRRRTKKMKRRKGGGMPDDQRNTISSEDIKKLLSYNEQALYNFYYTATTLSGEKIFSDANSLDGTYEQYTIKASESPDQASKWVFYVNDLVHTLRNMSTNDSKTNSKISISVTLLEKLNEVNFFGLFTLRFFPTSPLTAKNSISKEVYVVKKDIRLTTNQIALTMDKNYSQSLDSKERGPKSEMTIEILESYPDGVFVKWWKDMIGIENMFYLMNTTFKNDNSENKKILDNIEKNKVVKTIKTTTLVPTYSHFDK